MALTLDVAQKIVADALAYARAKTLKPMGIVVLDERGAEIITPPRLQAERQGSGTRTSPTTD